jgi:hypothetical protein
MEIQKKAIRKTLIFDFEKPDFVVCHADIVVAKTKYK